MHINQVCEGQIYINKRIKAVDIKSNIKYENVMVCSYSLIPEEGKVRYILPLSIKFVHVLIGIYI